LLRRPDDGGRSLISDALRQRLNVRPLAERGGQRKRYQTPASKS